MNVEIISWQILEEVPSASGIVKYKEGFYVIGDDSPYLFHLDKNLKVCSKTQIYSSEKMQGNRIPKIDKPDFEAMEMISGTEILIFGSGSKSPERDVCVLVEIGETITHKKFDVSSFYDHIREMDIMQGYELDIEGLALYGGLLYLFNRGRNIIFSFSLKIFLAYCKMGTPFPIPRANLFSLPRINGLQAGFSGATNLGDKPYLLFTASVEDTPNAYEDGDILGSFIGLIAIRHGALANEILSERIPDPGFPLKVESIIVDKAVSKIKTDLILVTDNDGAPSEILRIRIVFNETIGSKPLQ